MKLIKKKMGVDTFYLSGELVTAESTKGENK